MNKKRNISFSMALHQKLKTPPDERRKNIKNFVNNLVKVKKTPGEAMNWIKETCDGETCKKILEDYSFTGSCNENLQDKIEVKWESSISGIKSCWTAIRLKFKKKTSEDGFDFFGLLKEIRAMTTIFLDFAMDSAVLYSLLKSFGTNVFSNFNTFTNQDWMSILTFALSTAIQLLTYIY